MGVVGQWDEGLFTRFRDAEGDDGRRRQLLGELARVHDPLVRHLVRQMRRTVGGAHRLTWEDAMSAGRVALVRALNKYDPSLASLSTFLRWKMLDEIQRAVQETGVVMRGRHQPVVRAEHFENDEDVVDAPASASPLRDAIAAFLDEHCAFAADARVAANDVREKYEGVVVALIARSLRTDTPGRHESLGLARDAGWSPRGELTRTLLDRGVRRTMVRVPWALSPVRGFAGVRLQSGGEKRRAENARLEAVNDE